MKKKRFLNFFILMLLIIFSAISYSKTKVLSIYANPMSRIYTSLGKGKLLLSRRNEFDKEIKFVAKVGEVTVKHEYVEWNEKTFSLYPVGTGFTIKPQKNVVYSFMGIIPEGIPQARLVITYKGKQKVVTLDWGMDDGEELDHYDVYF